MRTKLSVIGDTNTGKSTVACALANKPLPDGHTPTTASDCHITADWCIWDTPGQEKFHFVVKLYLKENPIVLICVDLSQTFNEQNILKWIRIATEQSIDPKQIVIVGTKLDLAFSHDTEEQVRALCQAQTCSYVTFNPLQNPAQKLLQVINDIKTPPSKTTIAISSSLETIRNHFFELLEHHQRFTELKKDLQQPLLQFMQTCHSQTASLQEKQKPLQDFTTTYAQHAHNSKLKQFIIEHHLINFFSKTLTAIGATLLGLTAGQIFGITLVTLITISSYLLIRALEGYCAPNRGPLFGFFTPLDHATATLIHACAQELKRG